MTRLTVQDAIRSSITGVDPKGLLFEHEGRLYRAFRDNEAESVQQILNDPQIDELFLTGLVRFWRSDLEVDSFSLVVEVERISRVSYPTEWPTEMLRASAITLARLSEALAIRGLGLKDSHPWNVLFDGVRPVFIDLGSITSNPAPTRAWRSELRRHLLAPLVLHDRGWHGTADRMTQEHPMGPIKSRLDSLIARQTVFRQVDRSARRAKSPHEFYADVAKLFDALDGRGTPMTWSSYPQSQTAVGDHESYSVKQKAVSQLLQQIPPGTLLDLACNRGWYSELAARQGFRVTAMDIDDRAVGVLYRRAVAESLDILPLRLDLVYPPGSYGLGLGFSEPYPRIRSDVAIALALIHHLVRDYNLTFPVFARLIDKVSISHALIEFVPRDDAHVASWGLGAWYTEEAFVEAMSAYFPTFTRTPSSPHPRVLFLFGR